MKTSKPILVSLIFAFLLIVFTFFLKKYEIGYWTNAAILTVWTFFYFRYLNIQSKNCKTSEKQSWGYFCSKFLVLRRKGK